MRESELLDAIKQYTKDYNRLPIAIKGDWDTLWDMGSFAGFMTVRGRESVYSTPFGGIPIYLDSNTDGWRLE